MKLSVNTILFHWYTKKPKNFKSKSVQLSLAWEPLPLFNFWIDFLHQFGNVYNFCFNLCGILKLVIEKDEECDHAGFRFNLNIFGLDFEYDNKDIRHWDYDNDTWEPWNSLTPID